MPEFRSLVNFASDPALAVGSDSGIVAWNERAARLLGYTSEQTIGRPCYDILRATLPSGEPLCTPECEGKLCFARHAPFAVRACSLRHKDGRRVRASISTLVAPATNERRLDPGTSAVIFIHPRRATASTAPANRQLRVYTFGHFGLSVAGLSVPIGQWYRKHALSLLKLLITRRGEAVHREHVIDFLWPDANEHRGRERLKVTTHFLRQQLRAAGARGDVVTVENAAYALQHDGIWLDCEAFQGLVNEGGVLIQRGQLKDALACFEKAERLYRGDYLPEERYADWCAEERERLRELYFDMLGHMVDSCIACGDHERAAQICRRALVREPCREGFHRALMICLVRLGQRDRLVAHYDHCRKVLKAELGVGPAPETERLYRELAAADKPAGAIQLRR